MSLIELLYKRTWVCRKAYSHWSDIRTEPSRQIRTEQIIVQKILGNVRAEQRKSEISLEWWKSFIKQFLFHVNCRSKFASLETIGITNYRDLSLKIRFHRKFNIFRLKAKKSCEFRQNTFALLLHNAVLKICAKFSSSFTISSSAQAKFHAQRSLNTLKCIIEMVNLFHKQQKHLQFSAQTQTIHEGLSIWTHVHVCELLLISIPVPSQSFVKASQNPGNFSVLQSCT